MKTVEQRGAARNADCTSFGWLLLSSCSTDQDWCGVYGATGGIYHVVVLSPVKIPPIKCPTHYLINFRSYTQYWQFIYWVLLWLGVGRGFAFYNDFVWLTKTFSMHFVYYQNALSIKNPQGESAFHKRNMLIGLAISKKDTHFAFYRVWSPDAFLYPFSSFFIFSFQDGLGCFVSIFDILWPVFMYFPAAKASQPKLYNMVFFLNHHVNYWLFCINQPFYKECGVLKKRTSAANTAMRHDEAWKQHQNHRRAPSRNL